MSLPPPARSGGIQGDLIANDLAHEQSEAFVTVETYVPVAFDVKHEVTGVRPPVSNYGAIAIVCADGLQECCQVSRRRPKLTRPTKILGGGRRPSGGGLGAEASKRGPADEVTLGVEGVVDRCVDGEESLGWSLGLEQLLLSLSSSDRQVGVLRPIVLPKPAG